MKIITGATGQAHVNAADDGALYAALFGTSQFVLPIENQLEAEVIATTRIRIKSGDVMVHGRHARIPHGTYDELTIDNGTSGYKRNDIIVCHYEETDDIESMVLKVLKGTPTTGTPKDPDVVEGNILNGDSVHEFPLYRVRLDGINLDGLDKLFSVWDAGTNHKHTMNQIDGTMPMDRVTGTLPLDRTSGGITASRINGLIPISHGGTGASNEEDALDRLFRTGSSDPEWPEITLDVKKGGTGERSVDAFCRNNFYIETFTLDNQTISAGGLAELTYTKPSDLGDLLIDNGGPMYTLSGWYISNASSGGTGASGIAVYGAYINDDGTKMVLKCKNTGTKAAKVKAVFKVLSVR